MQNAFYKCSQTGLCNPFKLKTIVGLRYRAQQSVSHIIEGAQIRACTSYCRLITITISYYAHPNISSHLLTMSCASLPMKFRILMTDRFSLASLFLKMHFERLSKLWTFLRCDELFHWYMAKRTHP